MLARRTRWTARRLHDRCQKLEASREALTGELGLEWDKVLTRSTGNLHHVFDLLQAILVEKLPDHVQVGLELAVSIHCDTTLAVECGGSDEKPSAVLIRSVSEPGAEGLIAQKPTKAASRGARLPPGRRTSGIAGQRDVAVKWQVQLRLESRLPG